MTTTELHEILDNKDRKLSVAELKHIIYEMKKDSYSVFEKYNPLYWKHHYYNGEQNAFQIVLDLLEHLEIEK